MAAYACIPAEQAGLEHGIQAVRSILFVPPLASPVAASRPNGGSDFSCGAFIRPGIQTLSALDAYEDTPVA